MKSVQLYLACALILVAAAVIQVKASECPKEMIDAAKAMEAICVPKELKEKKPEDVTEQEKNSMEECFMRESKNHHCFDPISNACDSITDPTEQLECVHTQLAKFNCTPKDFERK